MKIGFVGSGRVGSTTAYSLIMRGIGSEIVMVDVDKARAKAEASDLLHAVPFAHPVRIVGGEYADLAEAKVVVVTAGTGRRPDETRLELLNRNAGIFQEVISNVLTYAPDTTLLLATNPVDVMTHIAAHYARRFGLDSSRVIGSGTTLDTARFRAVLAQYVGVDARHVHGYVVGEHGDSEVLAWSRVTVGGIDLDEFCDLRGISLEAEKRQEFDAMVRFAGRDIIAGKGATFYGIGSALAQIIAAILYDQQSIMTVCTPAPEVAGVRDVTVSLPRMLGGKGILACLPLSLSPEEQAQLAASAQTVRQAIDSLGLE